MIRREVGPEDEYSDWGQAAAKASTSSREYEVNATGK